MLVFFLDSKNFNSLATILNPPGKMTYSCWKIRTPDISISSSRPSSVAEKGCRLGTEPGSPVHPSAHAATYPFQQPAGPCKYLSFRCLCWKKHQDPKHTARVFTMRVGILICFSEKAESRGQVKTVQPRRMLQTYVYKQQQLQNQMTGLNWPLPHFKLQNRYTSGFDIPWQMRLRITLSFFFKT